MTYIHLVSGNVSVLIAPNLPGAPIVYWGTEISGAIPPVHDLLPAVTFGAMDSPQIVGMLPSPAHAWRGRAALRGSREDGSGFSPHLELTGVTHDMESCELEWVAPDSELKVTTWLDLDKYGMLTVRHQLQNIGASAYRLSALDVMLPVPSEAREFLDFTGRWAKEAQQQRGPILDGTWVRTARHGRTGHDHSLLLAAGTPGFGYESGRIWAIHLGWSGDHERFIDRSPQPATMIGAGEVLRDGEIILDSGDRYSTPTIYATFSDRGLNGISQRFHQHLRARGTHPKSPRPVVLNTWEAVYFDHSLERLSALAEEAAAIGVERFVLDDGWFSGRTDDQRALGDWQVDKDTWGRDLDTLIELVHSRGMEFGLWFEPEMVSLDSELARAHPDWVQRLEAERLPVAWRNQYAIDLLADGALQNLFDQLSSMLSSHAIDYIKWDFNRDNLEQSHADQASGHNQTLAFYELLDCLRLAHPDVEFESCASGGARIDLGVLARTDRVWLSDTNDALERQRIQRAYTLLLPPELQGSHVSSARSHTTGRRHAISFRALTALFGHFGIEADLQHMGSDREELAEAIRLYKENRSLLHTGATLESDTGSDALRVHGVVSEDAREALFAIVALDTLAAEQPGFVRIPGLDHTLDYTVQIVFPTRTDPTLQRRGLAWMANGTIVGGAYLSNVGLTMPALLPEHGILIRCTAIERSH